MQQLPYYPFMTRSGPIKRKLTYDVVVFTEDGHYFAEDADGHIFCQDSPTACLQEAVNYVAQFGGGRIYIKRGTYYPQGSTNIPDGINLIIEGEGANTIFRYTQPFYLFYHIPSNPTWTSTIVFRNFKVDRTGSGTANTDVLPVNYAMYVKYEGLILEDDFRMQSSDDAFIIAYNNIVAIAENNYVTNKSYGIWVMGYLAVASKNYVKNTAYVGIAANGFTPNLQVPPGFPDYGIGIVDSNTCINCGQGDEAIAVDLGTSTMYPSTGIIRNNKIITDSNTVMSTALSVIGASKAIIESNEIIGNVSNNAIIYSFYGDSVVRDNIINVNGQNIPSGGGQLITVYGNNIVFEGNRITINYNQNIYRAIQLVGRSIFKNNTININASSGYSVNIGVGFDFAQNNPYALISGNRIVGVMANAIGLAPLYNSDDHIISITDNTLTSSLSTSSYALFFDFGSYAPTIYFKYFRNTIIQPMTEDSSMYFGSSGVTPTFIIDWDTPVITYWGSAAYHYKRRNTGTATINSGSTSVTVNHGLICTPSKVLITPLAQPSGNLWVSNITSTSFTINISSAPSANLSVAWSAEC